MDVNEYFKKSGHLSKSELWEPVTYNDPSGKPITGPGRPASAGRPNHFEHPPYNDAGGRTIINNNPPVQGQEATYNYRPSVVKHSGTPTPNPFAIRRKIVQQSNFLLEIPILSLFAGFTRVSGLETEWEYDTLQEGGTREMHYFPKYMTHPNLVCEYGMTCDDTLRMWFGKIELGMFIRVPLMLTMLDMNKNPTNFIMIKNAYPVKYVVPELNALSSEVAVVRAEFKYTDITYIPNPIGEFL